MGAQHTIERQRKEIEELKELVSEYKADLRTIGNELGLPWNDCSAETAVEKIRSLKKRVDRIEMRDQLETDVRVQVLSEENARLWQAVKFAMGDDAAFKEQVVTTSNGRPPEFYPTNY